MEFKGSSVYDEDSFLQNFLKRRNREDSPNNIIEKPVLMSLIGDIRGKCILDLGCGDGRFGLDLFELGCSFYEGVEGSINMVKEARQILNGTPHKINHSTMEEWECAKEEYDMIISRMAFHYIEDVKVIFCKTYRALKKGGKFVFSVQHPVLTSSVKSARLSSKRTDWIVDDYFVSGQRIEPWIDKEVVKYHRTIEEYFHALKGAGFTIEDIREGAPEPEFFTINEEYQRRKRIPLFLLFECTKK